MKPQLLGAGHELVVDRSPDWNWPDLVKDLELETLLDAMGAGDSLVRQASAVALLEGVRDPDVIAYRQTVLDDCLRNPDVVRTLYRTACDVVDKERRIFVGFFRTRPETLLSRSVTALRLMLEGLRVLRQAADEHRGGFSSTGFTELFDTVQSQLDDDYLDTLESHIERLTFPSGLLVSAGVSPIGHPSRLRVRSPSDSNRRLLRRTPLARPQRSLTIPERDEAGFQALADLRNRAVNEVADLVTQAADHVLAFFKALRVELAFYLGGVSLRDRLRQLGTPICFPSLTDDESRVWRATDLHDPSLALRMRENTVGNDLSVESLQVLFVTGANQGGKSTFLRSLGVAQLMAQSGLFVAAEEFCCPALAGVATHFKREEDETMVSGKLDEELERMSAVVDHLTPGYLMLCNESFASTNEREGSDIAAGVVDALAECGVVVCFVTHLFDLVQRSWQTTGRLATFLRAERRTGGERTFRIVEGDPEPTSYGADVYRRVFGSAAGPLVEPTQGSSDGGGGDE